MTASVPSLSASETAAASAGQLALPIGTWPRGWSVSSVRQSAVSNGGMHPLRRPPRKNYSVPGAGPKLSTLAAAASPPAPTIASVAASTNGANP